MTSPTARLAVGGGDAPDRIFRVSTRAVAAGVVGVLIALAALLLANGWQALAAFGPGFVTGTDWDPIQGVYGAFPFIVGTVASALLAVLFATPIGILTAVFLAELAPRRVAVPLTFAIELLAAIPSVVYGLWGVFVLGPFLGATVEAWISGALGWIPLFAGPVSGTGLFAAAVILTLMILPTIVSISRDVITGVPDAQREAMLALGATRWETITGAVLPYARSGIAGAVILGLGRALGETMAVTMVIGNRPQVPSSVFDSSQTIASQIATTFNEASLGLQTSVLIALGLILLVITMGLNVAARLLVARVAGAAPEAR